MRAVAIPLVALACLSIVAASRARAQSITRAERQYLQADFDSARQSFRAVLQSATLDRAQAADAHRYLAAIELAFGNRDGARAHLEAALLLSRDIELPSGAEELEPTMTEILAAMGTTAGLHITSRGPLRDGRPTRIVARLEPAPPLAGDHIQLRCTGAEPISAELPEATLPITPRTGPLSCTAELETTTGAVLLSTRRAWTVGRTAPRTATQPRDTDTSRGPPLWPFLVGGGALVAITTVVVILATTSSSDEALLHRPTISGWPGTGSP